MRKVYFIPGPSQLYPTVPTHFQNAFKNQIPSISHRSKQFEEIYQALSKRLKKLLDIPEEYYVFIIGSANEAMERTIQNCVEKYSFHFINGSFSKRFFSIAQDLGKRPASIEVSLGEGFDFNRITVPKKTELICFTHNETSTGVMTPVEEIYKVAKQFPEILIAVDTVSSAPYVNFDFRLIDVMFFSVQKLFGLPAGMGMMIVSPRAIKKAEFIKEKGISVGSFHSFPTLVKSAQKNQTPETPPVLEMYVLEKVIEDMLLKGLKNIRKETEQKANVLYDFLDKQNTLSAFVKEKKVRSYTTIVVDIQKAKVDIRKQLAKKGFIVLGGYGANKDIQIRIANYPAHSLQDVQRLIKQLKTYC